MKRIQVFRYIQSLKNLEKYQLETLSKIVNIGWKSKLIMLELERREKGV